ncbi:hypothetical protein Pan258_00160 [Symmachiella dynata]|uniref:GTPase domain-containing protein n=1 Tax=Symmachiella dynata TaxID=2527995 RepID=UPI00118AC4A1|nr:GTPase domain-containing protein [Symmachiella dynata]QDT45999.1 hypothetical protein Pan258_00160 [Symmachiella dynata]
MTAPELAQLEMLAQVDELVAKLNEWVEPEIGWEPLRQSQALVRRLLRRIEGLRVRLESPLVVATFGGTGTGKSALVNALVGREISPSARQRPTTIRPMLLVHSQTDVEMLGLPLDKLDVVQCDTPVLRDIAVIDCPDPDTSEAANAGSNLEQLHQLLPHCDVLIYTSTQQKYRSARVVDELGQAATGCRLLFVQTHADVDEDIRNDWISQLDGRYEVPDVFFVDSLRALREQQAGQRPSGDFGRLQDLLTTQLAASQRTLIRRANLVDLVQSALDHCRTNIVAHQPQLQELEEILQEQRHKLIGKMSDQLCDELLSSRNLWERRLISSVTQNWGMSPFSSVLRLYNGLGNFIASFTLFRARSSAQVALIGAAQGVRWLAEKRSEHRAESRLERLSTFGLDDSALRESQVVINGYVQSAKLDPELAQPGNLDSLRNEAARLEDQFLGDATTRVDQLIDRLADKHSGFFVRWWYELLLMSMVGYILFWPARNFFYDMPVNDAPPKSMDYYVTAAIFLVLWSGTLVMLFTRRLRKGLNREITELAQSLAQSKIATGLFPDLESTCAAIETHTERLEVLSSTTKSLRRHIATPAGLGAAVPVEVEP